MPAKPLLETARFRVVEHRHNSRGQEVVKQTIEHPGAVVIVPLLAGANSAGANGAGRGQEDHVLLIRNYRVAVDKTLIELPAGTLEPPEPPRETARRELAEETGFSADELTEMPPFYMSPGILNERMHCFVAHGLTPGEQRLEPGEQIEPLPTPLGEAIAMIASGQIEDAKTIVALLRYQAFGPGGGVARLS